MKPIADDTIYRTPRGKRVRIVTDTEVNRGQVSPIIWELRQARQEKAFVVAEVSNGKRWYGYKPEDLTTEKKWLANRKKA